MVSKSNPYTRLIAIAIICSTISCVSIEDANAFSNLKENNNINVGVTPEGDFSEVEAVDVSSINRGNTVNQLISNAYNYIGTQYIYGANGPNAFDCSGFTKYIFSSMGIDIPRTSQTQYQFGLKIDYESLQCGDLVFFNTYTNLGHVGIYIGNGEFIHASCSKGVTVSSLSDYYYRDKYAGAVRY